MGRNDQGCPGRTQPVHPGRANSQPGRSHGLAELKAGRGQQGLQQKDGDTKAQRGARLAGSQLFQA